MFESISLGVLAALRQMDSMGVTGLFVVVMVALFVAALTSVLRGRASDFYQTTPTLLTTLGILGTFLGIAIGLLEFDASQVEYSIPLLLDGLKLAFVTSIVGILLSAALRLILVLRRSAEAARSTVEMQGRHEGDSDLTSTLQKQADAQLATTQRLLDQVTRLDGRLNQVLERQHEQLLFELRGFAEQLGEMGSRQLIAALESVIRDFNDNLGEQFGENFRRLDASVEKLLRWQDQYREHMDLLGQQLDHAIDGVNKSEASLRALTQQAHQISGLIQDQESTMISLRRENMELEALLTGIANLREKAESAFPAIDNRLRALLESIEGAVLSALNAQQRLGHDGLHSGQPVGANHPEIASRINA